MTRDLTALAVILAALVLASPAAAAPAASLLHDVSISAARPNAAPAAARTLVVKRRPARWALLKFRVSGVGDRELAAARLRLFAKRGRRVAVHAVRSGRIGRRTTWRTRPELGDRLDRVRITRKRRWISADVRAVVDGDGVHVLAVRGASRRTARLASRESRKRPRLRVTPAGPGEAPVPTPSPSPSPSPSPLPTPTPAPVGVVDGLRELAASEVGSSDPTYYAMQHRAAVTAGGRMLALHGRHKEGVRLAWRDPDGGVGHLDLLSGSFTGDWPASIAIGRDGAGAEHAWVIWAGASAGSELTPVQIVKLSGLDAAGGPAAGPITTLDEAPALGHRPDVAVEPAAGGDRVVLVWSRRKNDTEREVVSAWIEDIATSTPVLTGHSVLLAYPSTVARYATLEPGPAGTHAVLRGASGRATLRRHLAGAPLAAWTDPAEGRLALMPAAAVLADGTTVVASDNTDKVEVQRFAADGTPPGDFELSASGYREPSLVADGSRIHLLMVRVNDPGTEADNEIVSRTWDGGWSGDRLELAAGTNTWYQWPNAVRHADPSREPDGAPRMRFVVRGAPGPQDPDGVWRQFSVLSFQRTL